jgi:hypothetical protein
MYDTAEKRRHCPQASSRHTSDCLKARNPRTSLILIISLPGRSAGTGVLSTHTETASDTLASSYTTTLPGLAMLRPGCRRQVSKKSKLALGQHGDGRISGKSIASLPIKDLHGKTGQAALCARDGGHWGANSQSAGRNGSAGQDGLLSGQRCDES